MLTILPGPPLNAVGPGLPLNIASDFVGPLPSGSGFVISYLPHATETAFLTETITTQTPRILHYTQSDLQIGTTAQVAAPQPNTPTDVVVDLTEPGSVLDHGVTTLPWDPTSGLGVQAFKLAGQAGAGGLTSAQAQQLLELHQANFPILNLDGLALTDLTAGVPSGGLTAGLATSLNGVIVRITQIPPELTPIAGDTNYWRQTLAQVSIYRSNDLWLRFPVHTQSRMFLLPGSEAASGIASQDLTAWLLNMHLTLTTFPGVLAEVFLMHTP